MILPRAPYRTRGRRNRRCPQGTWLSTAKPTTAETVGASRYAGFRGPEATVDPHAACSPQVCNRARSGAALVGLRGQPARPPPGHRGSEAADVDSGRWSRRPAHDGGRRLVRFRILTEFRRANPHSGHRGLGGPLVSVPDAGCVGEPPIVGDSSSASAASQLTEASPPRDIGAALVLRVACSRLGRVPHAGPPQPHSQQPSRRITACGSSAADCRWPPLGWRSGGRRPPSEISAASRRVPACPRTSRFCARGSPGVSPPPPGREWRSGSGSSGS